MRLDETSLTFGMRQTMVVVARIAMAMASRELIATGEPAVTPKPSLQASTPISHAGIFESCASTWPRDSFQRSTIATRPSKTVR
jgi:hypothetical protein